MKPNGDHAEIAWGNWTQQFKKSPVLEAFVKSLYHPANDFQKTLKQLRDERCLDTASGAQLDGIGVILGQSRRIDFLIDNSYFGFAQQKVEGFGQAPWRKNSDSGYSEKSTTLNDANYRKFLYCRIFLLKGRGTGSDIHHALSNILHINRIRIADLGNAKLSIYISLSDGSNRALLKNITRWLPKAAGIGYQISLSRGEKVFGFKSQRLSGFGAGSLAYQLKETI